MGNSSDKLPQGQQPQTKTHVTSTGTSNSQQHPEFLEKLAKILEKKALEDEEINNINKSSPVKDKKIGINKKIFMRYVCKASETCGDALYKYFLINEGLLTNDDSPKNLDSIYLPKQKFIRQATKLLNCGTDTQQLEYYIKVFARNQEEMDYNDFLNLVLASYDIASFAHHTSVLPDEILSSLSRSVMHGKSQILCHYVMNWCCQTCPRIVKWLHRYISHSLKSGYSSIMKNMEIDEQDNETPILDTPDKSTCASVHPALIWMLSCTLSSTFLEKSIPKSPFLSKLTHSPKIYVPSGHSSEPVKWTPLFNSDEHGMSINRFKHHAFDYHGPTLLFLTTDDQAVFCVASDQEWRDSKHFYGGHDSMCLKLLPEYKVIERGANIVYFNSNSNGFPMGFQIGANHRLRALTLDLNLEHFEYKKIPYKLTSIEVWGCGTAQTKLNQMDVKKQAHRDVTGRRKVKVPNEEWRDNPDRCLLEMAGTAPSYARFEKATQSEDT